MGPGLTHAGRFNYHTFHNMEQCSIYACHVKSKTHPRQVRHDTSARIFRACRETTRGSGRRQLMIAATPDYTAGLAAFLSTLNLGDVPPRVVERAKDLVLDHLGVALHSANLPWSAIVRDYAKATGDKPESTLYGHSERVGRRVVARDPRGDEGRPRRRAGERDRGARHRTRRYARRVVRSSRHGCHTCRTGGRRGATGDRAGFPDRSHRRL